MSGQTDDPTGILIVRLWLEHEGPKGMRARIMQTLDSNTRTRHVSVASTPEDIHTELRGFIEEFLEQAEVMQQGRVEH